MPSVLNKPPIDVFISHSHRDEKIAKRLIALLKSAMPIDPRRILCSSVPGHELSGGVPIDTQLRNEILNAPVFIALLTRGCLKSAYVLFELGARWGFGVHSETDFKLIPLLAAGMKVNELRDIPLGRIKVHSCDKETDLQQLVDEICLELDLTVRNPNDYRNEIEELKEQSAQQEREETQRRIPQTKIQPPKPVVTKENYIQRENMKRELRNVLRHNNRKWAPKRVKTLADRVRISEDDALKLLESMPDMIVSTAPEGYKIVKKK